MKILTVIQGPDRGKRFPLPMNEPQLIGRSSESLRLNDLTISRRHAELAPNEGHWFLADQASANGTFLNGRPVMDLTELQIGDQIRTGSTVFLYTDGPAEEDDEPEVDVNSGINAFVSSSMPSSEESLVMAVREPTAEAGKHLKILYELTNITSSTFDRKIMLDRVMDLVFEHFGPDRGFVLYQDDSEERPKPLVVRFSDEAGMSAEQQTISVSRSIVRHVISRREGVLSSNAQADGRFSSNESIVNLGIRSAICVPMICRDRCFGVIHIDSLVANYTFTDDQLRLLTAVGAQAGMALGNLDLYAKHVASARLAAIGETVANLSHSIRNMIQGIRGGSEVVELGFRKEDLKVAQNGWGILSRNLDRMNGLTMNMLAYSKNRKPEIIPGNLAELMEEVLEISKGLAKHKKVRVFQDIAQDMPPIPFDSSGIHQAITNLLHNSIDAVAEETGEVKLTCTYDPVTSMATISVLDNGPGIDPDVQANMFQLFYSTKGQKGTGLGLAVTKKIIDEHRGKVTVRSSENKGTEFIIQLSAEHVGDPSETRH